MQADSIRNHIGYPDFILNETALVEYYAKLELTATMSYFDAMMHIAHWWRAKTFERLLHPFDKDRFAASPAAVNAFYSPVKNAISG